jgi:DNA-binding ferritin-like protein (Dps family)
MAYLIRCWNDYNQAYTIVREYTWHDALKRAREMKQAFNQPAEIYERREVI